MRSSDVEEVVLLRASTTEDEFRWHGTEDEVKRWENVLEGAERRGDDPPMAFTLQLHSGLRLMVAYGDAGPRMTLQGPSLSKAKMTDANRLLEQTSTRAVEQGMDHIVFEVFTGMQMQLHDMQDDGGGHLKEKPKRLSTTEPSSTSIDMRRVIFWTHHLKAPSKKRDMNRWCSELDVFGVVKSGYPGFLCFEGGREGVEEIVRRIKALQWHAITVKTDVPYTLLCDAADRTETLLRCPLAHNHSSLLAYQRETDRAKLRTGMDEIEDSGLFVERLRQAGIPEDEIMFALNLRS